MGDFIRTSKAGVWFAIRTSNETIAIPFGVSDGKSTPAVESDIIPMGSYAKPWTAAAILRLVEQGKFKLDDPFVPIVDP